jgi:uncharacterized membrane protein YgdD (TMEM256/DUF423 family)
MVRLWILIAALAGLVAVAAGAFAAHALAGEPRVAALVSTAAQYALVHALALLALAALARDGSGTGVRLLAVAGWCFVTGIVLFSGGLFLLAATGIPTFATITPFGGVAFLLGWAALAVYAVRLTRR